MKRVLYGVLGAVLLAATATTAAAQTKLTIATSKAGGTPSGNDSYGPYVLEVPECPIVGNSNVAASTATTATVVAGGAGWAYNSTTGQIWINHADYLTE